jgi:CPA1 family monovalent cation:H+ antiporter
MPLLRAVRPSDAVSSVLRWESILVDPLGAILALLTFNVIIATQSNAGFGGVATSVAIIVAVGLLAGAAGGQLFGLAIRKRIIPDFLRDYSALAAVLAVFSVAESLQGESGFLAVTLMGIWLANMRDVDLQDVLSFKESITLLLIGGLFILLAAKLDLNTLLLVGTGAFAVLGVLQLIAGPLRALVSSIGGSLSWREILFIGWVFPRGIVAAAVSSLFALRLVEIDYPGAESLVPLVFSVIIGTVVIQSLTTSLVARVLDVAEPERTGVLVVGANPVARMIAQALKETDRTVLVADSHWASVRKARMLGLSVFYGSPVSTYAEDNLDLTGLGTLLAVSRQPGLNELACVRFAEDFGRDHVYVVGNRAETAHAKHNVSGETSGRVLFGGEYSIDDLIGRINSGASIKTTELTSEFGHPEYKAANSDSLILFAIDPNGRMRFPVADERFEPVEGWTVSAIVGGEQQ